MTRYSEIEKAAKKHQGFHSDERERSIAMLGFLDGARWADEHPSVVISYEEIEKITNETLEETWLEQQDRLWRMIERNLRAQFIRKACEWLYVYNKKQTNKMFGKVRTADVTINVEQFRKAMKGEEL